jgi:hypothetical protein
MKPKVILVLSSWSSGSSAVSGFLCKCGVDFFAPYFQGAIDERTPNTYESIEFRDLMMHTIDEWSFEYKVSRQEFLQLFKQFIDQKVTNTNFSPDALLGLKHPLSVFWLREITEVIDPVFVVVTRAFEGIERTRVRRNWFESYGLNGAKKIYGHIYSFLQENGYTFLAISYDDFLDSPEKRLKLIEFCDISMDSIQAELAFKDLVERR